MKITLNLSKKEIKELYHALDTHRSDHPLENEDTGETIQSSISVRGRLNRIEKKLDAATVKEKTFPKQTFCRCEGEEGECSGTCKRGVIEIHFECQQCGETDRHYMSENPDFCDECAIEDIICPTCKEHTERGGPCCA